MNVPSPFTPSSAGNNSGLNPSNHNSTGGSSAASGGKVSVLDKQHPEKIYTPLVRQFLDYLRLEKHFSDYTIRSYGADLQQYGQYLAGEIGPGSADPNRVPVDAAGHVRGTA